MRLVNAEGDGLPQLAAHWRRLAAEKDALAVAQLEAAGRVRGGATDIRAAVSDERYENDVLYPKMTREVDPETAKVLEDVVARQKEHLAALEALRLAFQAAEGDVAPPAG